MINFLTLFCAFTLGWTLRAVVHARIDGNERLMAVNLFGAGCSIAALFLVSSL